MYTYLTVNYLSSVSCTEANRSTEALRGSAFTIHRNDLYISKLYIAVTDIIAHTNYLQEMCGILAHEFMCFPSR